MNLKIKRLFAFCLAIFLFICQLDGALADETYYKLNGSKTITTYVRLMVPGSKTPEGNIGHYDMMISGALHYRGMNFKNPCFSYTTDGKLRIFSESETSYVYPHEDKGDSYYDCKMYYWKFTVKGQSKMGKFMDALDSVISSASKASSGHSVLVCKIKSGNVFSKYSASTVNCFLAVATWLKGFGNSKLWKIYEESDGNALKYMPYVIVKKYSGSIHTSK